MMHPRVLFQVFLFARILSSILPLFSKGFRWLFVFYGEFDPGSG